MRTGIIVAYSQDVSAGIIQTEDFEPHYFSIVQWKSNDLQPGINMKVTFEITPNGVRNVHPAG